MNERIQKLAEQAGFNLIRENCYDMVSSMSVQEFADLIVQKCIETIKNESMNSNDEWEDGLLFAENAIREYFGVKS